MVCIAIDIGASSGQHIVGWMEDGRICTDTVYRFPNCVQQSDVIDLINLFIGASG